MRALVFILAAVAALPAAAAEPAGTPAKPKRVCRFVDTGNPMKIERVCRTVAAPTPAPAAEATAAADKPVDNAQVALAEQPPK